MDSSSPSGRSLLAIGDIDKSLCTDQSYLTAIDSPSRSTDVKEGGDNSTLDYKTPLKGDDMFRFSILQGPVHENVEEGNLDTGRSTIPMDVIGTSSGRSILMSPLAAEDSIRTQNQHVIDLNLRVDAPLNTALVYIKPNANTSQLRDLVHDTMLDYINPLNDGDGGGRIVAEYDISCEMIGLTNMVDNHYGKYAKYAMQVSGMKTGISPSAFHEAFGEELEAVKQEKRIFNAREALSALACDPQGLERAWREAEVDSSKGKIRSFDRDMHIGNLYINEKNVYVINGCYMAVRGEYVQPEKSIHVFIVEWNGENLSWKEFMSKVIGADDPKKAEGGSLNQIISVQYEELGLESAPTEVYSAIHASASPLEGLAERINWCSRNVFQDNYGRILLGRGIPESRILDWVSGDAVVDLSNEGKLTNVFDLVKEMDSGACAKKLTEIYDYELFGPTGQRRMRRGRCHPVDTVCCTIS